MPHVGGGGVEGEQWPMLGGWRGAMAHARGVERGEWPMLQTTADPMPRCSAADPTAHSISQSLSFTAALVSSPGKQQPS